MRRKICRLEWRGARGACAPLRARTPPARDRVSDIGGALAKYKAAAESARASIAGVPPKTMDQLPRQSSRFKEMQEYLEQVIKIPKPSTIEYAEGLVEEGFDSIELFDGLTVEELRQDCGFKIGHAKQVELSQKERGVGRFAVRQDVQSSRSPQVLGQPIGCVCTPHARSSQQHHAPLTSAASATGPNWMTEASSTFTWTRSSAKEAVAWCIRPY